MEENFVREKGKIAASIMCSGFDQVMDYVHEFEKNNIEFLEAEVQMVPTTTVALDEKGTEKMERLIERLEELDDVANIYHNWEE